MGFIEKLFLRRSWRVFCIVVLLSFSAAAGFFLSLTVHAPQKDISSSSPPIAYHSSLSFVKQVEHDPRAGRKIFNEFCTACHADSPLINVGAPRLHDKTAWKMIRKKNAPASRLSVTVQGQGAMPARGGCFECSDKQLQQTIDYMLKENKSEGSLRSR